VPARETATSSSTNTLPKLRWPEKWTTEFLGLCAESSFCGAPFFSSARTQESPARSQLFRKLVLAAVQPAHFDAFALGYLPIPAASCERPARDAGISGWGRDGASVFTCPAASARGATSRCRTRPDRRSASSRTAESGGRAPGMATRRSANRSRAAWVPTILRRPASAC